MLNIYKEQLIPESVITKRIQSVKYWFYSGIEKS